jgi:polysaccharide chain length determinant protein (PEP-CTERM system associated)
MPPKNDNQHNIKKLFLEHVVTAWKSRWLVLAVAWVICVAGWVGVMLLPQRYESNARVYVNVNGLLAPLLKGLVVDTTPEQSEEYLRQTLLSRPNLEQVIVLANLGGQSITSVRKQELVLGLARDFTVASEGNNLITISYVNRNPVLAKNVVEALLSVFAERANSSSRAEMDHARAFLTGQIESYQTQLQAAEKRRADFKKKYADYFNDAGVEHPDTLRHELEQANQQYQEALASRNAIATQMRQVPQLLDVVSSAPTVSSSGQIVVGSSEMRLSQAEHNLAELKLLYTDKHPDVLAAERSVRDLRAEVVGSKAAGGSNVGKSQVPNPAYDDLRMKLVDAEASIPVLKQRLDKVTHDYNNAISLSATLPDVTARSQGLDRDYDVIRKAYDELLSRREAANLSQAADDRADRTQFRTIDPPEVPIFPSFPNRQELFSVVLLLGLAAGAVAPLGMALIRPTFVSMERLYELGLPVIGAVSFVPAAGPRRLLKNATLLLYSAAFAGLLLSYGGLMLVTAGLLREIL